MRKVMRALKGTNNISSNLGTHRDITFVARRQGSSIFQV